LYTIEISPVWFFEENIFKGESIAITGSVYVSEENTLNVIARRIQFRGNTITLRDKHGFPNWRGGGQMGKGQKRKRKKF
jgi:hypothetical protein